MAADVDDDLSRARAEFEHWRSHAAGRGRIPSHLWAMALSLVEHHSVATVCGELGLNPGRLRARLNEHARSTPKRRTSKPAFVELRPIDVTRAARAGAAEGNTGLSLQIDRTDGSRLTLTIPTGHSDLIAQLCTAFLRP